MTGNVSIKNIVDAGLCIGCGLCEALAADVSMKKNRQGSLRPYPLDGFTREEEKLCTMVCPGIHIKPSNTASPPTDAVWGHYLNMQYAWAKNETTRHIGSTGGVLTALGQYLIKSGTVDFIYHVKADDKNPLDSKACISETTAQVLAGAGSRYAPVAPLAALDTALNRNQPFAVIAKPCDLSAIENLSVKDKRINQLIRYRLTMVCGGQSTAQKAETVLKNADIPESQVTLYRHRGHGNPGPTRIETNDGRAIELTYQALWADEVGWSLESRCKLCADALGECADIAAADVWPGGSPTGEDEGFNGVVVRTEAGQHLIEQATKAGFITLGRTISIARFNDFQPHQLEKKQALKWRFLGLKQTGAPEINAPYSRLNELGQQFPEAKRQQEADGARSRFGHHNFTDESS